MKHETKLLIIGAGPFGLTLAAQASFLSLDHLIVGQSMEFWRKNMPKGMFLRSASDWHLDPQNIDTIDNFLSVQHKTAADVEPLSLDFYLSYADWFRQRKQIKPLPLHIERLCFQGNHFVATASGGETIQAEWVVIAPGFKHFTNIPADLKAKLPPNRLTHTCNFVNFSDAKDRRYLIVGGRQSAYEWTALLLEAGAREVHMAHRHKSPAFAVSEWAWVTPLVDHLVEDPSWFKRLTQKEKDELNLRLWAEGRLKVEPWLEARLNSSHVHIWPETEVLTCVETKDGDLLVELTNGNSIVVDQVVAATGYKVDISKLPIVSDESILPNLAVRDNFPVLDDHLQTSIPGLFITSMPATRDFGPFFAFTISTRASAKIICEALTRTSTH